MAFVKLDCAMLTSTIWVDREARELFITALLMARPRQLRTPMEAIQIGSLEPLGFTVPAGWYGFVEAAGPGIVRMAGMDGEGFAAGMAALARLSDEDQDSRTPDHGGRRLVRVDGGFVVLNYFKHRDRDHTAPERARRYRDRAASRRDNGSARRDVPKPPAHVTASHPHVTHAEAEVYSEIAAPRPTHTGVEWSGSDLASPEPLVLGLGGTTVDPLSGAVAKRPVGRPPKRHALPEDWVPNAKHTAIAKESGRDLNLEAEKFRDWAASTAAVKADWPAAFRNWLRSGYGRGNGGSGERKTGYDHVMDALERMREPEPA